MPANTIVVGYDGSDGSKAALKEAVSLATDLKAKLVVGFSYEVSPLGGEVADFREAVKELGEKSLKEAVATVHENGLEVETDLVEARPAEGIVRLAELNDARCIVVGCYGEKPLTGAILGSTAHKLLNLSEIPVLVVQA